MNLNDTDKFHYEVWTAARVGDKAKLELLLAGVNIADFDPLWRPEKVGEKLPILHEAAYGSSADCVQFLLRFVKTPHKKNVVHSAKSFTNVRLRRSSVSTPWMCEGVTSFNPFLEAIKGHGMPHFSKITSPEKEELEYNPIRRDERVLSTLKALTPLLDFVPEAHRKLIMNGGVLEKAVETLLFDTVKYLLEIPYVDTECCQTQYYGKQITCVDQALYHEISKKIDPNRCLTKLLWEHTSGIRSKKSKRSNNFARENEFLESIGIDPSTARFIDPNKTGADETEDESTINSSIGEVSTPVTSPREKKTKLTRKKLSRKSLDSDDSNPPCKRLAIATIDVDDNTHGEHDDDEMDQDSFGESNAPPLYYLCSEDSDSSTDSSVRRIRNQAENKSNSHNKNVVDGETFNDFPLGQFQPVDSSYRSAVHNLAVGIKENNSEIQNFPETGVEFEKNVLVTHDEQDELSACDIESLEGSFEDQVTKNDSHFPHEKKSDIQDMQLKEEISAPIRNMPPLNFDHESGQNSGLTEGIENSDESWLSTWVKESFSNSFSSEALKTMTNFLKKEAIYTPKTIAELPHFLHILPFDISHETVYEKSIKVKISRDDGVQLEFPRTFKGWAQVLDKDLEDHHMDELALLLRKLVYSINISHLLRNVIPEDFEGIGGIKWGYRMLIMAEIRRLKQAEKAK